MAQILIDVDVPFFAYLFESVVTTSKIGFTIECFTTHFSLPWNSVMEKNETNTTINEDFIYDFFGMCFVTRCCINDMLKLRDATQGKAL